MFSFIFSSVVFSRYTCLLPQLHVSFFPIDSHMRGCKFVSVLLFLLAKASVTDPVGNTELTLGSVAQNGAG